MAKHTHIAQEKLMHRSKMEPIYTDISSEEGSALPLPPGWTVHYKNTSTGLDSEHHPLVLKAQAMASKLPLPTGWSKTTVPYQDVQGEVYCNGTDMMWYHPLVREQLKIVLKDYQTNPNAFVLETEEKESELDVNELKAKLRAQKFHARSPVALNTLFINKNILLGESTFKVFRGMVGNCSVAVKVISIDSIDRLTYAVNEIENSFRVPDYAGRNGIDGASYAIDVDKLEVYVISKLNNGHVPTKEQLEHGTSAQRGQWIIDLASALADCHHCNVFHQDVRNGPSRYKPNVMIDHASPKTLRLIDLGDSVRPETDEECVQALCEDVQGILNFVEMCGNGDFNPRANTLIHDLREFVASPNDAVSTMQDCCRFLHDSIKNAILAHP